jgi:hypothetical protein
MFSRGVEPENRRQPGLSLGNATPGKTAERGPQSTRAALASRSPVGKQGFGRRQTSAGSRSWPVLLCLFYSRLDGHLPSPRLLRHVADAGEDMSSPTFIPAAPPPPGVTPNFDNPAWIGYRLIIVSVVFPVFGLFFLIPRLYSAGAIIRKWHPDDCETRTETWRRLVLLTVDYSLNLRGLCTLHQPQHEPRFGLQS